MFNFIITIAVLIGVFVGFYLITGSIGISIGAAIVGAVISFFAVGAYAGQRKEEIKYGNEAPLDKDRTPEKENRNTYNPSPDNQRKVQDPTK
ncbi:SoxR reducing system RseC family protein [Jeotgalibacillus sp. R-1-5s-1]|uniref:SoxR reducing system RseC family protein n=1 Tax=Jeotgalibacillus sp. R-1-5s-1 TaxID=2555897 RepID=UPI00106CDECC|nr:SoxR reducing system RseC family protein [Jeotgalibacillus sp. R-1-5s-1]TFD92882.1 hypothetical protein E2491_15085 [Jeotgalibacillus sp. R-1-5s-1]